MQSVVRMGWLVAILGIATGCEDENNVVEQEDPATGCECPLDWEVDNIAICAGPRDDQPAPVVFSTRVTDGKGVCEDSTRIFPHPQPAAPWTRQRISSVCTGRGTVCFALKQGSAEAPTDDDCTLAEQCVDFDYTDAEEDLELPPFDGWSVTDRECASKYGEAGGYLEFRVEGSSLGCEVDGETVRRVQTCPSSCEATPDSSECQLCTRMASEMLNTSF